MPLSTNIAVLSIINIYTVSIFLCHKYTILLIKGRNISVSRCAPLPRTVSKFWKRKRKLLSCVPVLDKTWGTFTS